MPKKTTAPAAPEAPPKERARPRTPGPSTTDAMPRSLRGKLRTRAKLIEAAMRVMGQKGVEGATINDITEAADVGFGSFYNHFKTKEDIAQAVFEVLNDQLAARLDAITSEVEDAPQAVAYVQLAIAQKAVTDPVWGWFLVHANSALKLLEIAYHERAKLDFARGTAQGRFSIPNHDLAATVTLTSLMGLVRSMLEGTVTADAARDLVELLMRMYGLPHDEARRIARARVPAAYQL
ncbi:TetR/AcrR family transcriptional regulator [Burkholderia plantarii]|uniref:TetR/AcrR family transcriptional regulator n=1 Tax=Burkholderia plantarii TaxID=41899 RepID=UPI0018DE21A4|nr:TetR/AcrR family transcriptional regulator [Burkholderia plantarii]MBI0331239.1 TetR/AcrR family transcriptional regulator [Burkholderia plantarii]